MGFHTCGTSCIIAPVTNFSMQASRKVSHMATLLVGLKGITIHVYWAFKVYFIEVLNTNFKTLFENVIEYSFKLTHNKINLALYELNKSMKIVKTPN